MKDWTGNSRSYASTLGARNFALEEREKNDYYATDPKSLEIFLERLKKDNIQLDNNVWECACGEGHLSNVLVGGGYNVLSTDKVDRGYGEVQDFLEYKGTYEGDILTNPPYKFAKEFVEHSIECIKENKYVMMFLKLQFLEGKARRGLFEKYPPKYVYVFSQRQRCAMNGDFSKYSNNGNTHGAVAYCWYIWQKGFKGEPIIRWI
jgi:hypothetical protein